MHDNVLASVLEIARNCRLRPHHLPKGYFAVDNTGIKIDNKQPDGLFDFGDLDGSVLFDVGGTCPTSQSSLALNAADHTKTMQNAADDKSSKYLTVAEQRAVGFVPFVFNTYDGLHFSAQRAEEAEAEAAAAAATAAAAAEAVAEAKSEERTN